MYETAHSDDDSEWASDDSPSEHQCACEAQGQEADWLRQAAAEAHRQWDMFVKVPRGSYKNLSRTQSSLLTQLLNPDPKVFPPDHPCRRKFSSQDVTPFGRRNHSPVAPLLTTRSAVALPQEASVVAKASHVNGMPSTRSVKGPQSMLARGPPQSIKPEDSDSEAKVDDGIRASQSLAQQKLAALADLSRRRYMDLEPEPSSQASAYPQTPTVATAPMPFNHPYNLPAPAPPMTPRTTRRHMLSTELSESLRRNLLWERQVSRNSMMGPRPKSNLSGGPPHLAAVNSSTRNPAVSGTKGGNEGDRERGQRVARNRSWAGEFHFVGW